MRKLVVTNLMSLDGYVAGPGNSLMGMPFGPGFSEYNLERLRTASTLLVGRMSFENFRAYWPSVADDDQQPPGEREISRLNNAIEKIVVSDTLSDGDLGWAPSRVVRPADLNTQVEALKKADGQDILVFGSRQLWNELLELGLVDELHMIVGPGLMGGGVPAFKPKSAAKLALQDARKLDGAGLTLLRYAIKP